MKIERLKLFLDLYDTGSYTQTAKLNYISQTSVTQFINSLESELHVKLFNRATLPITPTEAGKAFQQKAQIMYNQYINAVDTMLSFSDTANYPINICYTSPIDLPILVPIAINFKQKYPEIKLNISRGKIKDTVTSLRSMNSDIVIGLLNPDEKLADGLKSITLYEGVYDAVISKDDPLASKDKITALEAFQHPLVMFSPEEIGVNYNIIITCLETFGITPDIRATVNDHGAALFSVATEQLLTFVPSNYSLGDFSSNIIKKPISDLPSNFKLYMVYRECDNPSVHNFVESCSSYLKIK